MTTLAGIVVEPEGGLSVVEGGSRDAVFGEAGHPAYGGDVTVNVAGHGGTDVTLSDESLVFTSEDWDTPQAVTLSAAHDDDAFDESVVLVLSGADGGYDEVAAELAVAVVDDDTPAVVIEPQETLAVEEGGSAQYSVALATRPSGDVTVTVSGHVGTDVTLSDESLVFTPDSWGTPQAVTVTVLADDNAFDESVRAGALPPPAANTTPWSPSSRSPSSDDDIPAIVVEPEGGLSVVEGASGAYSVRLATRPSGDVTVTIAGHVGTDVTLSDESLVFTPDDWDIAHEVTVTVLADDDAFDESVVLVHVRGRRRLRRGGR